MFQEEKNSTLPDKKGQFLLHCGDRKGSQPTAKQCFGKTKGPYLKISVEKKASIYAAQHGIVAAVCHFSEDFPDSTLKDTEVYNCKVK